MVTRWAQALVHETQHLETDAWAPGRAQLYVDDPAITSWGSPDARATTFSLIILWWLVLGIPLSWKKGAVHDGSSPHSWIGDAFCSPVPGVGRRWLPRPFVLELVTLCRRFLVANYLPMSAADALVGRAGRVAHVLDHCRP